MKISKYILIGLTAAFSFSCEKDLEQVNQNQIGSDQYWQTEEDLADGVTGIYNRLLRDGAYMRTLPSLQDGRGDDVTSASPWTIYPLTAKFTVQADYDVLQWPWRDFYDLIDKANSVLYYAPEIEFEDQDYKGRLEGQAYFLRALAYFTLINNYEQVPLVLEPALSRDEYYPETATPEETWAQIESDLLNAKELLPETYVGVSGADNGQLGRATWGAATGLLGKVYMFQEKWSDAEEVLGEVIESGVYSLVPDYADNFTMNNENNSESLFEIQFGNFGTDGNWVGASTSNWRQGCAINFNYGIGAFGGYTDLDISEWIYEEYQQERCVDGTLDPRMYTTIVSYEEEYDTYTDGRSNTIFETNPWESGVLSTEEIYIGKYTYARIPGYTIESDGILGASTINYRVMRYAEVLLLYAEALNELGNTNAAYPYIQEVRDRANLPDLATEMPNMTQAEMREQLAHERALELAVEGIRFFDIQRWGWLYDSEKLEELRAHDSEFDTWTEGNEYLPIPQVELDVNPNLSPNSSN